jgi:hypothetical protein
MTVPASTSALFMGRAEARRLTEEVKVDAAALWRKLHQLYEGKAHLALGYSSWQDYCAEEFDFGKSTAYRLLDAGRVVAALETAVPQTGEWLPSTEAVARELVPVLRNGEREVVEVWRNLRERHGDEITAAKVHEAVTRRLENDRRRLLHADRQPACAAIPNLPVGRYAVLLADPPWRYDVQIPSRAIENHYPSMALEDIKPSQCPPPTTPCCSCGRRARSSPRPWRSSTRGASSTARRSCG